MITQAFNENINHIKEIVREIYVFTNQLDVIKNLEIKSNVIINNEEKKLLTEAIIALTNELKILNNSTPSLIEGIGFYRKLNDQGENPAVIAQKKVSEKLIQVNYKPIESEGNVSITINDRDRKDFLENISKSNLSINQLKKKYAVEKPVAEFGRPNLYAKLSNKYFRKKSMELMSKGYFQNLNNSLRKMNSPFVVSTYVSMVFFTVFLTFIFSIILTVFLLFYNVGLNLPFISSVTGNLFIRFAKIFWIIFIVPIVSGFLMYYYPTSEGKSIGAKIDQELPFVAIHMSAIATSGIEPISIFKIILRSKEYAYTNIEFRKLLNLINFHGSDIVTALKTVARTSPSPKLKELLDGLATTITSGGSMHDFLDKHADGLLFDYKMDREKYTKISETMMDIYISVVIAAPMVLMILFVIIGSTGGSLIGLGGLSTSMLSLLIILIIILLNIGFLAFLRFQQPNF